MLWWLFFSPDGSSDFICHIKSVLVQRIVHLARLFSAKHPWVGLCFQISIYSEVFDPLAMMF